MGGGTGRGLKDEEGDGSADPNHECLDTRGRFWSIGGCIICERERIGRAGGDTDVDEQTEETARRGSGRLWTGRRSSAQAGETGEDGGRAGEAAQLRRPRNRQAHGGGGQIGGEAQYKSGIGDRSFFFLLHRWAKNLAQQLWTLAKPK